MGEGNGGIEEVVEFGVLGMGSLGTYGRDLVKENLLDVITSCKVYPSQSIQSTV